MSHGIVKGIFIAPERGMPMQEVEKVRALEGKGLEGDRYAKGAGSFNRGKTGKRQVTLINGIFFEGTDFEYHETRRNIVVEGTELMFLIGKEFTIGEAVFRGYKYCDPCNRPSGLLKKKASFKEQFHDRGGLIAEVVKEGIIRKGDKVIPPPKGY